MLSLGGGALGLWFLVHRDYRKKQVELVKSQKETAAIRAYFSQIGNIQVIYINAYDQEDEATTGGVLLVDGREFVFAYFDGYILEKEIRHD